MKAISDAELTAKWYKGAPSAGLDNGMTAQQIYAAAQAGHVRAILHSDSRWWFEKESVKRFAASRRRTAAASLTVARA